MAGSTGLEPATSGLTVPSSPPPFGSYPPPSLEMSWDSRAPQDPGACPGGHERESLEASTKRVQAGYMAGLETWPTVSRLGTVTRILKNNAQAPTGRLSGLEKLQSLGPRLQPVQVAHGHRTASPVAVVGACRRAGHGARRRPGGSPGTLPRWPALPAGASWGSLDRSPRAPGALADVIDAASVPACSRDDVRVACSSIAACGRQRKANGSRCKAREGEGESQATARP